MSELSLTKSVSATVRVKRVGQFVQVSPPCDELKQALQTKCLVPSRDALRGCALRPIPIPLCSDGTELDDNYIACWRGLEPVVIRLLNDTAREIRLELPGGQVLSEPFPSSASLPCDPSLLNLVRRQDRGVVRFHLGSVNPSWLIAQVALAWPNLSIAVVATKIGEAREMRQRLHQFLSGVQVVTSRNNPGDGSVGRVVVTTFVGLGHHDVEVEKRDIVFVLNAREANARQALSCLGFAARARLYGFIRTDARLAPQDRDVLRLLFGFHDLTIPRHGCVQAHVEVIRFRNTGGPRLDANVSLLELKRRGIWQNHRRNRRLARLAQEVKNGAHSWLPSHQLGMTKRPQMVVVLVENMEHSLALANLLPGWPLLGKERITRGSQAGSLEGLAGCAISTASGLSALGMGGIDVLIRADGGVGLPPIPPILFWEKNWKDASCSQGRKILVDFDDLHHPLLRRRSRQRQAKYAEAGWFPFGKDPIEARIEHFLATRPREES